MPDEPEHKAPDLISWLSVYGEAVKKSGISDIQREKLRAIVELHEPREQDIVQERKRRNKRKRS